MYHNPVLLHESVEGLNMHPHGTFVDVTFGGGGHSKLILSKLEEGGKLFAFDQDQDALANVIQDQRFVFIPQNFKYLKNFLLLHGQPQVDGILADLGVSSHQFDEASRGFSTRFEGKLDMRMDKNNPLTAADVVNTYDQQALTVVFNTYGELQNAWRLAQTIIEARNVHPIKLTTDLRNVLAKHLPRGKENKTLAQVFQALRIEVNQEMQALESFLEQSVQMLKPGGRLVVISYHSLEDRLVKNLMKTGNVKGETSKDFYGNNLSPFILVSRKAVIPTEEEIAMNPRARSAKLRIAEKR